MHAGIMHEQLPQYGSAPYKPTLAGPKTINPLAMVLSLIVPFGMFTFLYSANSFALKYYSPYAANVASLMCCGLAFLFGYFAVVAFRKWRQGGNGNPGWYAFIFVTSLIACGAGLVVAQGNFTKNMRPYYDIISLNRYPSVDPSKYKGSQLMDMGEVTFTPGSHLELSKSMGFRNLDNYCVAPVVSKNGTMDTYDFWAVGLNCCSGHASDFACGEFNNPYAHSGLRLMHDDLRSYFRLAVLEAAAAYNIKADHPIFLYWMQDTSAEILAYQDQGYKQYLMGSGIFFGVQLFLVVAAAIAFRKAGL